MNKYQEAISNYFTAKLNFDNEMYKAMDLLEELVDKETPMKPIETKWEYACGKCMNAIHVKNEMHCEVYCDNCGQKIDWSDEE